MMYHVEWVERVSDAFDDLESEYPRESFDIEASSEDEAYQKAIKEVWRIVNSSRAGQWSSGSFEPRLVSVSLHH